MRSELESTHPWPKAERIWWAESPSMNWQGAIGFSLHLVGDDEPLLFQLLQTRARRPDMFEKVTFETKQEKKLLEEIEQEGWDCGID